MSLKNCIDNLAVPLARFDTSEVIESAKEYIGRGLSPKDAGIKAVQDHLDQLERDRKRIENEVLEAMQRDFPEEYAALAGPVKAAEPVATSEPVEKPAVLISEPSNEAPEIDRKSVV